MTWEFKDREKVTAVLNAVHQVIVEQAGEDLGLVIVAIPIPSVVGKDTGILVSTNSPERSLVSMLLVDAADRYIKATEHLSQMN